MTKKLTIALSLVFIISAMWVATVFAGAPVQTVIDVDFDFVELTFDPGPAFGGPTGNNLSGTVTVTEAGNGRHVSGHLTADPGNTYTIWGITPGGNYRVLGRVSNNGQLNFGHSITDDTFEFHVIDHGPKIQGDVANQIHFPNAGCLVAGSNQCGFALIVIP